MAGPGSNELGSVSIGVQATGTDAAIQDLKRVEEQGKQTAKSLSDSISGDMRSPNGQGLKSASSLMDAASRSSSLNDAQKTATQLAEETNKAQRNAAKFTEELKQATRPVEFIQSMFSRITAGITLLSASIAGVWAIITNDARKSEEAVKRMFETSGKAFKIHEELFGRTKDSLDKALEKFDEMTSLEESLYTKREQAAKLEEVRAKHRQEREQLIASYKQKQDNEDVQKTAQAYQSVLKETEAAENAARLEGLTEEQRIQEILAQKREEINRRIAATTDQYTIDLLNRQLQAAETVAQKQTQALQDKRAKERADMEERYREEQERIAETARQFSEAFTREARSASESIRDAFRDANTTNYLRDAAASLRAILQQRRL